MNSYTIVIIHGTYADPEKNWFPWLKDSLLNIGHTVVVPKFPTPEGQTVENWIEILDREIGEYNEQTILVGHSSAPLVISAKLQELSSPIRAAIFVAPFFGAVGNPEYDRANNAFNTHTYTWEKIKTKAREFVIFRSDNDPYVPEEQGRMLSEKLGVPEIRIAGGGHLNAESGFTQFPLLLNTIHRISTT